MIKTPLGRTLREKKTELKRLKTQNFRNTTIKSFLKLAPRLRSVEKYWHTCFVGLSKDHIFDEESETHGKCAVCVCGE